MFFSDKYSLKPSLRPGTLARTILDSINSGIIIVDHQGKIVYVNTPCEKMLDVSLDKIKNMHYATAFARIPTHEHFTLITLETGQEFKNIGFQHQRHNNLYITTDTILLKNGKGDKIGAVAVFKDVTDIHSLHEQLRESHKASMLGHMAAGMAHDILNPLTTAKGFTQVVSQKTANQQLDAHEIHKYLQVALNELETINNSVRDFIKAAKFKPATMESVDLNVLVYQTVAMVADICNDNCINLELNLSPQITTIGEEVSLKQALLHILDNALDILAAGGGHISIATYKDTHSVYLVVTDNGSGITEENLEAVFTPFFSTHIHKKGMGLPIAKRIIHSHGGEIKATSARQQGTSITISLPQAQLKSTACG